VIQSIERDITDLKIAEAHEKEMQKQLLRSERLSSIGRLAASVAHELKNPLGAIKNALYYINDSLKDSKVAQEDPTIKEISELAGEEIERAIEIIGDLLDFSRVMTIIPRTTDINQILRKIPVLIKIPEDVKFELDLDPSLPPVLADPDRLQQVFGNLVGNALQAMPTGGALVVSTAVEYGYLPLKNGDHEFGRSGAGPGSNPSGASSGDGKEQKLVSVTFKDTGTGIPPEHIGKIFEPLFTTKARGTGLGLAISLSIIEKHGGSILVSSQPARGTTFTIKLPLRAKSLEEEVKNHDAEVGLKT